VWERKNVSNSSIFSEFAKLRVNIEGIKGILPQLVDLGSRISVLVHSLQIGVCLIVAEYCKWMLQKLELQSSSEPICELVGKWIGEEGRGALTLFCEGGNLEKVILRGIYVLAISCTQNIVHSLITSLHYNKQCVRVKTWLLNVHIIKGLFEILKNCVSPHLFFRFRSFHETWLTSTWTTVHAHIYL